MKTTTEFIDEANAKHNFFYDYSKTNYTGANRKLTITCPKHGDFQQTAGSHLAGYKCKGCGKVQQSESSRMSFDEFIRLSIAKHGSKYNYSEVKWTKAFNPVEIICPEHGSFITQAFKHYKGQGCQKCSKRPPVDTALFLERAKALGYPNHSYEKTKYINSGSKVTITCTIHGDYQQTAFDHYSYPGCQACRYEKSSKTLSRDRSKTSFDGYKARVAYITQKSYQAYKDVINPMELPRGKGQFELDHIYSIREGFENMIDPEIVGHYTNLQMLTSSQNSSKGSDCWKTMADLYLDFNEAMNAIARDQSP